MIACFMEGQGLPDWTLLVERLGPGMAILVFTGAVVWKLLPAWIRVLGAWSRQSEEFTKAIPFLTDFAKSMTSAAPDALDGLRDLADNAERIADHVVGSERSESHRRSTRLRRNSDGPYPAATGTEDS
jgi:hypothetical protein